MEWSGQRGMLTNLRQFQETLNENPNLPNNLLMSDEAQFNLPSTVNEQNFWHWSVANPHELLQSPLYDSNFTVWCAVWFTGVNGPCSFEDEDGQAITVISQRYTEMINEFLAPELPPNHNLWSQQDGSTVHTVVISKAALRLCFLRGWFIVSVMYHGLLVHRT